MNWRTPKPKTISSIAALSELVELEFKDDRSTTVLYRGHGAASFELRPKVGRFRPPANSAKKTVNESLMLELFRRQSADRLAISYADDWELLAIAQHHGLATRLLDWTRNPLVALYFAVCKEHETRDNHGRPKHEDAEILAWRCPKKDLTEPLPKCGPLRIEKFRRWRKSWCFLQIVSLRDVRFASAERRLNGAEGRSTSAPSRESGAGYALRRDGFSNDVYRFRREHGLLQPGAVNRLGQPFVRASRETLAGICAGRQPSSTTRLRGISPLWAALDSEVKRLARIWPTRTVLGPGFCNNSGGIGGGRGGAAGGRPAAPTIRSSSHQGLNGLGRLRVQIVCDSWRP